jgi:hypothetical protein
MTGSRVCRRLSDGTGGEEKERIPSGAVKSRFCQTVGSTRNGSRRGGREGNNTEMRRGVGEAKTTVDRA